MVTVINGMSRVESSFFSHALPELISLAILNEGEQGVGFILCGDS